MGDLEYVYIPLTTDELRQEAINRNVETDMDYQDRDICIWHIESKRGWYRKSSDIFRDDRLTLATFKEIDHLKILISLGITFEEIKDYYTNESD